ncbi:MAG: helicase-associated domain-containing protein, partial [Ktedonobacteraceae bacterium]|nr:helicase-associated domain-containing protein [Ktedonobacteraceae bacterium]
MDQNDLDLLQMVPPYHLQTVAKTRHVPLSPLALNTLSDALPSSGVPAASSPTLVLEVAQYLLNTTSIREVLQDLDELETAILRELVLCGGRTNSRDLALYFLNAGLLPSEKKSTPAPVVAHSALYQPIMPLQPPQYPAAHPHGAFEQAIRHLLIVGFVFWGKQTNFSGRDYTSGIHDGVLIVPQTVQTVVRNEWHLENVVSVYDAPLSMLSDSLHACQRSLYLYWSFVASMHDGLALVNNGLLARSALRQLIDHLSSNHLRTKIQGEQARLESDQPYLLFLRLLLVQLGLLQERNNILRAAPAEDFFSLSLVERVQLCYHLILTSSFWNELLYLPEVNVRPLPQPFEPAHEEVIRSRQLAVERLLRESVEDWHDFSAFIARTKLYVPYLLFPRHYGARAERYSSASNPYGWDFRLRRGWLTHREGWHMVEGGFMRAFISGPLYWLGLVEVDQSDPPLSFRLLPEAPILMSNSPLTVEASPASRLIVQPNFEVLVLAPVSEVLLVRLDRFAERISLEHIAQYRITKVSVTAAIRRGLLAETMIKTLQRASEGEIPQNVRYSLMEWERQARRVEVWPDATLLEVENEALLDTLWNDPQIRPLFARRLSSRLVEVAPYKLPTVQALLWQRNYLPALSIDPGQETNTDGSLVPHEPQWHLFDDGRLQPVCTVLNFYLVAEVERFSECDGATGEFRLTPSSVRRALSEGTSLESIVSFLRHYCDEGVPGSFLVRLKIWGDGYARQNHVYVEPAPLLRLSAEVLRDLYADDELSALLGLEVE